MKRKFRYFWRLAVFLIILYGISRLLYEVFWGKWFQVQTVYIEGNSDLFSDISIFRNPGHLIILDSKKLAHKLKSASPWVDTIVFKRRLPTSLYIIITEKVPLLRIQDGFHLQYVSESGVILPALTRYDRQHFPRLSCKLNKQPGQEITESNIKQGLKIVADIKKAGQEKPNELVCENDGILILKFAETQVIFDQHKSPTEVVNSLLFLFKQFRIEGTWPKTVDLRFDKPILKIDTVIDATDTPDNQTQ